MIDVSPKDRSSSEHVLGHVDALLPALTDDTIVS